MKNFIVLSGRTTADLQSRIESMIVHYCTMDTKAVPYGNIQFLNNEYIMTFIIEKR